MTTQGVGEKVIQHFAREKKRRKLEGLGRRLKGHIKKEFTEVGLKGVN
jgi:hypothetical protein